MFRRNNTKANVKTIARLGLLTALALILGYLETLIPLPAAAALPGVKLGLSNCAVLLALCLLRPREAFVLLLLKIVLSALLFAGPLALLYSLSGGLLSFLVMLALKRLPELSLIVLSMAGAAGHNAGQLVAAGFVVGFRAAATYAPFLLLTALLTGAFTGSIAQGVLRILEKKELR